MDAPRSLRVAQLLAAIAVSVAATPGVAHGATVLRKVREIRSLSRPEADRLIPVEVHCIITLNARDRYLTFCQDETGAIYINHANVLGVIPEPGDRVEIRGVTGAGLFAPVIDAQQIQILEHGPLPAPAEVKPGELHTGYLDSRYVQISGVVRSFKYGPRTANSRFTSVRLILLTAAGRMTVLVLAPGGIDPEKLIGTRVEARGPVVVTTNRNGQLIEEYVATRSFRDLKVVAPEAYDPTLAPLNRISDLMLFQLSRPSQSRVRVRGVVTLMRPGHMVVIQDGNSGLEVDTDEELDFPAGSVVEAIGFPTLGGYSPVLSDARLWLVKEKRPVVPVNADAISAAAGKYEAQLIRIRAKIVAHFHDQEHQLIWLEAGGQSFAAISSGKGARNMIDEWADGSEVELTGVCHSLLSEDLKEPVGFRVWLRSSSDVKLIRAAPWWTGAHLLQVFGGTILLALLTLSWSVVLRRRVRRQTAQIQKGVVFERDRNQILEMVGSNEPLDCIFTRIRSLVERQVDDSRCSVSLNHVTPEQHAASLWSVPIMSAKHITLGTLDVVAEYGDVPGGSDREFLENVARLAGIAIEHRQFYDRLTRLSQEDSLTGLANRMVLEDRLHQAIGQASRYNHLVACMYIDLDGFKQVNDTLGHRVGDLVLRTVAERIRCMVRETDTVARLGGDEFCLVLPHVQAQPEAYLLGERLLESVREPMLIDEQIICLSASVGISFFPEDGLDVLALQRNADTAMYRVKNSGKNRVSLFRISEWEEMPPVLQ